MAFIDWSKEFETGIETIDFQHRKLFNLINNLEEAVTNQGLDGAKLVIEFTLDQLAEYTVYHFEQEERMMAEANYPDLENHKKMHQRLAARVVELKKKIEANQPGIEKELLSFLSDWIKEHILHKDIDYVPKMRAAGVGHV